MSEGVYYPCNVHAVAHILCMMQCYVNVLTDSNIRRKIVYKNYG
jgi:hypothetical protein